MLTTLASISSLLISFALLCMGHGLQNTLIGVRSSLENYDNFIVGVMMSLYFVGFLIGTSLSQKYIEKVGHIRTFAAVASLISTASLLHAIIVDEYFWIFLRFIYGLCIAGGYMVIESWLNELSSSKNRGRIMSIYMIINFSALALSQQFFMISDGSDYLLFAVVSILVSVSLVPLILSKARQPESLVEESLSIAKLYKITPLSAVGSLLFGIISGAFWGLSAVYFKDLGLNSNEIAELISISFIGGLTFQWIIGYISDYFNRRIAILICAAVAFTTSIFFANSYDYGSYMLFLAFIFGGFSYPIYSLLISLANDFMKPGNFVKASATMLNLHAIGSIIGPLMAGYIISINLNSFFYLIAFFYFLLFSFAIFRMVYGGKIPEDTESFNAVPRTSNAIYQMDPRYEEPEEPQTNNSDK